MLVYRIEHKDNNIGPYWNDDSYKRNNPAIREMGIKHTNDNHPSMWNDCNQYKIKDVEAYHCAFISLNQLSVWFEGWLQIIHDNDYIIATYETDDYRIGTYQVVFNKSSATRIKEFSIPELILSLE